MVRKINTKQTSFVPFKMPLKETRPLASSFSTLSALAGMDLRWGRMSKTTVLCLSHRAQVQSKPARPNDCRTEECILEARDAELNMHTCLFLVWISHVSLLSDHCHHDRFVKDEDGGHSCLVFGAGSRGYTLWQRQVCSKNKWQTNKRKRMTRIKRQEKEEKEKNFNSTTKEY